MSCEDPASLWIAGGRIYLDRELHERYFRNLETVSLLRDGEDLLIVPVASAASGGYLMKIRNSRGDRVIEAADVLRDSGLEDAPGQEKAISWSSSRAALRVQGFRRV